MKIICVPLTLQAMKLLDRDDCPKSLLESISLSQIEHETLIASGVFTAINSTLGKIIDDHEDEIINTTKDLTKTLAILEDHLTPKNSSVIKKLTSLNTLAIQKGTGLFFFLLA